jgi:alpha-galactosidase
MLNRISLVVLASGQGVSKDFPPGWNGEAKSPPQGWRSWNAFGANINDTTFRSAVDIISAKSWELPGKPGKFSLLDVGYNHVGIDEGWENCSGGDPNNGQRQHDPEGFPLINTDKFPSLKALVDYGHSHGVKMGWYLNGCACGEKKERLLNYKGDIQRLHEFGFDAAKFDGCGAATNMTYYAELMLQTNRSYEIENCHWGHCGSDSWYHNPDGSSCPTEQWW